MRTQDITLESEIVVIINHDSKTKCEKCGQDILFVKTKTDKYMPVELVGLAKWDIHNCKEKMINNILGSSPTVRREKEV